MNKKTQNLDIINYLKMIKDYKIPLNKDVF